jgi:hypothetical protein
MKKWLLTQKQCAEGLGLTSRQIHNLVEQGMPRHAKGGKAFYPWPRVLKWYIEFRTKDVKQAAPRSDVEAALDRRAMAEAQLIEIELAEAQGLNISLDTHEERVRSLCEPLAARCRSLSQYIGDVQLAKTEGEASTLLETIGHNLLRALTDSADAITDEETTGEPDERAA